jgi:hypothetical protein
MSHGSDSTTAVLQFIGENSGQPPVGLSNRAFLLPLISGKEDENID